MKFKEKVLRLFLNALPVILMIALIPSVENDYVLSLAYVFIISGAFLVKRDRKDFAFLIFGFITMAVSEFFFISTGVETFIRNSLLGLMPVWLPLLWAYAFVAIRRGIIILDK